MNLIQSFEKACAYAMYIWLLLFIIDSIMRLCTGVHSEAYYWSWEQRYTLTLIWIGFRLAFNEYNK